MQVRLDDIMKVEDELGVHLTEAQRTDVLNEYYELDSNNKIYQPWSDVVENLILELLN
jgi:hypothetical protein